MRAILLAAGMGTRLRPLTLDTPKSLVKVNGKPMLERQIEFLHEKGIKEIIVVTGYLKDKFNYLEDKYGVKLVHNDKFDIYNINSTYSSKRPGLSLFVLSIACSSCHWRISFGLPLKSTSGTFQPLNSAGRV